jgi:hypothetical protein
VLSWLSTTYIATTYYMILVVWTRIHRKSKDEKEHSFKSNMLLLEQKKLSKTDSTLFLIHFLS